MLFRKREKKKNVPKSIEIKNLQIKAVGKCKNIILPPNVVNDNNINFGDELHCKIYTHDNKEIIYFLVENNFVVKKVGHSKMITIPPNIFREKNLTMNHYIHLIFEE